MVLRTSAVSFDFVKSFFAILPSLSLSLSLSLLTSKKVNFLFSKKNMGKNTRFPIRNLRAMKNNFMCGVTFHCWLEILWKYGKFVDWITFLPRVIFLTLMSLFNSMIWLIETLVYSHRVRKVRVNPRPIFILGHPRTGTTHIHNLMSCDPTLGFPTTFHCGFPNGFLLLERFRKYLTGVVDEKRPMDNMKIDFDLPQEDELAVCQLSAGTSPYMPLFFMREHEKFDPFFSFHNATEQETKKWSSSFMWFLRKVSLRWMEKSETNKNNNNNEKKKKKEARRLVLKSPCHTARIDILMKLFPNAQFVYIHRNPYEVFQSACNMAKTTYWFTYLQIPSDENILSFIVSQYKTLFNDYIQARNKIDKGNLVEVSFEELENHPMETMEKIYKTLNIESLDEVKPVWEDYLKKQKTYKKNEFAPLPEEDKELVMREWGESFDAFGYEK